LVAEIPVTVEAELTRLRAENARLLRLLKLTPQQARPPGPIQAAYFDAPPGPVGDLSPPGAKVAFYATLFAARTDVCATRFENPRTGKSGWVPAVHGGWRRGSGHSERDYLPLTPAVLASHLKGEVHVGLYPLLDRDSGRGSARICQQHRRSAQCDGKSVPARSCLTDGDTARRSGH
jgi:hypothetical protein